MWRQEKYIHVQPRIWNAVLKTKEFKFVEMLFADAKEMKIYLAIDQVYDIFEKSHLMFKTKEDVSAFWGNWPLSTVTSTVFNCFKKCFYFIWIKLERLTFCKLIPVRREKYRFRFWQVPTLTLWFPWPTAAINNCLIHVQHHWECALHSREPLICTARFPDKLAKMQVDTLCYMHIQSVSSSQLWFNLCVPLG